MTMPGFVPTSSISACTVAVLSVLAAPALAQNPPSEAVIAARVAAAKVIVDHHARPQGAMLRCIALEDAKVGEIVTADWRDELAKANALLARVGIPPSERDALLLPVRVETLTRGDEAPAALKASCDANKDWMKRWNLFQYMTFAPDLTEALSGMR
jgi:hypothetical protein